MPVNEYRNSDTLSVIAGSVIAGVNGIFVTKWQSSFPNAKTKKKLTITP
jgi:hypothetical protein